MEQKKTHTLELTDEQVNIVLSALDYAEGLQQEIIRNPSDATETLRVFKGIADTHNYIAKQCGKGRLIKVTVIGG